MPHAAIDIGSNSVLLLVADDEGRPLLDESTITRLGTGLGDRGLFQTDRMEATQQVLLDSLRHAARFGVEPAQVRAVATSAARRALNAPAFFERIQRQTGLRVRIISGEEEARLTWAGAAWGLTLPAGPLAVADLGGGSTEIVIGQDGQIEMEVSLELGAVRLTERFFGDDDGPAGARPLAHLREAVQTAFAEHRWSTHPRALVAVGGTVTTLAAMELGQQQWDPAPIHGLRLGRATLRRWMDRLATSDAYQRRQLAAVSPERAEFLLAGACVLEAACTWAGRDSLRVSVAGLRHGLIL